MFGSVEPDHDCIEKTFPSYLFPNKRLFSSNLHLTQVHVISLKGAESPVQSKPINLHQSAIGFLQDRNEDTSLSQGGQGAK